VIGNARIRLPRSVAGREGFSIVEVLAAMIILAVGLLALQAMAIGASQRIAAANRQTAYTHQAGEFVEQALNAIRLNADPATGQETLENGALMQRVVTQTELGTTTHFEVAVTVTPPSDGRFPLQPVRVVGHAIR
jgi:prepilin-type N-terminal cleavage/methylation domain-containing protein